MQKILGFGFIAIAFVLLVPIQAFADTAIELEFEETIITVKMNGASTFYLDSSNNIIRALVEIHNFNPGDGYYFMKVTHLPTNTVLKDFEIFPKSAGNDVWSARIAYPIMESDVVMGEKKLFGEYEIIVYTEFNSKTASVNFSILQSQEELISNKIVTEDIQSNPVIAEPFKEKWDILCEQHYDDTGMLTNTKLNVSGTRLDICKSFIPLDYSLDTTDCQTLEDTRKTLQVAYGGGHPAVMKEEVRLHLAESTYLIKEHCTEPELPVLREATQHLKNQASKLCSDKQKNHQQEQRNAAITGGGPKYTFNLNNCLDEQLKILQSQPEPEPLTTQEEYDKCLGEARLWVDELVKDYVSHGGDIMGAEQKMTQKTQQFDACHNYYKPLLEKENTEKLSPVILETMEEKQSPSAIIENRESKIKTDSINELEKEIEPSTNVVTSIMKVIDRLIGALFGDTENNESSILQISTYDCAEAYVEMQNFNSARDDYFRKYSHLVDPILADHFDGVIFSDLQENGCFIKWKSWTKNVIPGGSEGTDLYSYIHPQNIEEWDKYSWDNQIALGMIECDKPECEGNKHRYDVHREEVKEIRKSMGSANFIYTPTQYHPEWTLKN